MCYWVRRVGRGGSALGSNIYVHSKALFQRHSHTKNSTSTQSLKWPTFNCWLPSADGVDVGIGASAVATLAVLLLTLPRRSPTDCSVVPPNVDDNLESKDGVVQSGMAGVISASLSKLEWRGREDDEEPSRSTRRAGSRCPPDWILRCHRRGALALPQSPDQGRGHTGSLSLDMWASWTPRPSRLLSRPQPCFRHRCWRSGR